MRDGEVLAACEEAKLGGRAAIAGIPRQAIHFCLQKAGASAADVDAIALDGHPWRLWGNELRLRATSVPRDLRVLAEMFPRAEVMYHDHHRSHAAAGFFGSGFDRSLILTLDSGGEWESAMLALGEGNEIRPLATANFPDSPGFLYSQVTMMLGWRAGEDEHRTQWLSTTGKPTRREVFDRIFAPLHRGELKIESGFLHPDVSEAVPLTAAFLQELGVPDGDWRNAATMPQEARAAIAASLQASLEDAVVALAAVWRKKTDATHLCFGGGVAFNALLVAALASRAGFVDGFVSPVAGNAGCALGAAWLSGAVRGDRPRGDLFTPYLGPSFTSQQVKDLLDNCRLPYRNLPWPQMVQEVADRLAEGRFVGWFQGAAEFGPRALGNRSILAAPADEWVKENLNAFTKRRESFRPLAASIVEEEAATYFDFPWTSPPSFLGSVSRVKDPGAIPGLAFAGNQARVHVVTRAANRPFHELLTRVGQVTGRSLLINTSFNAPGEPLVVSPADALKVFFSTGIDVLILGDFLISKSAS